MAKFPISVPYSTYRGNDPAKRRKREELNRAAERVEKYLNTQFVADGCVTQIFSYAEIARKLGLSEKLILDLLYSTARGGDNGITIHK